VKADDAREFLDGYAAAWLAGDVDAAAAHHALPLILATRERTTFVETEPELLSTLRELAAEFDSAGGPTAFDPFEITPLPDDAARVRARWSFNSGDGREMAYTLAKDDDGVIAVVAIEADG